MTARFDAWHDIARIHHERHYRDVSLGTAPPAQDDLHAIVLAGGRGTRVARLVERISGKTAPKQYNDFGASELGVESPSLLQRTLARMGRYVPEHATHVVIARDHVHHASRQLAHWGAVTVHSQTEDCGTAVAVLWALLEILVAQPQTTVVVTPSDAVTADSRQFDVTLDCAVRVAASDETIVLVGAEPSRPIPGHNWLVPFDVGPLRNTVRMLPFARYVDRPSSAQTAELQRRGALVDTMMVVAHGRALLDVYARLVPRVLRLFLYAASLPPAERSAFVDEAYRGLGQLDLHNDLLAMCHGLRIATLPREVGWLKIESDVQALAWLASRMVSEPTQWPLRLARGSAYRRLAEPAR